MKKNWEKPIYEIKPLVMLIVAVLALIQIEDNASIFEISGYLLLAASLWILYVRFKYRGIGRKKSKPDSDL